MPAAVPHRCATCHQLTTGACQRCHRDRHQRVDRRRGSAWSRGYDTAWQRLRRWHLSQHPLCADCETAGELVEATDVDHIEPFDGRDDPRRLDPSNLRSLCHSCHSRKTVQADGGFRGSDVTGNRETRTAGAARLSGAQMSPRRTPTLG
jgi:5-methylcytosine-specific restriction enzyme A